MKPLPPRHRRLSRLAYHVARFFAPDPLARCSVLENIERVAAHRIRLRHHEHEVYGREHLLHLGEYEAGEIIRKHNVGIAFDYLASQAIAVLFPKRDDVVISWCPFRTKPKLPE